MTRTLSQKPSAIYARGWNAAMRKLYGIRAEYGKAFAAIRARAERAECGTLGKCIECRFWTRKEDCQWGYCDMSAALKLHPDWPSPWAYIECGEYRCRGVQKLSTHGSFGCVNYAAPTPTRNG